MLKFAETLKNPILAWNIAMLEDIIVKICNLELSDSGLVFVAGRPGRGKSYAILEMANELKQKVIKPFLLQKYSV